MGLNMPAKTVVFTSVKKWDGDSHRYIGSGEYIQVRDDLFFWMMVIIYSFLSRYYRADFTIINMPPLDEWKGRAPWQR